VTWVREWTIPTDRPPFVGQDSANFADRGSHVVSVTDPYDRILGLLNRSRYFFFQVAPQLYSRGWVDHVPDSLLLRKSGSSGNRTRTSGSVARNSDHCTIETYRFFSVCYIFSSPEWWWSSTKSFVFLLVFLPGSDCQSQSQSHITTDSHSASPFWCQAPIWDQRPIFPILSFSIFRQFRVCWCGAPSLTRTVCSTQGSQ
jgi:hypothetical protein